jgi:hypothetical protein
MNPNTKFFTLLQQFKYKGVEKRNQFENHFVFSTFFLFLGFVCGNLFGTFLTFFRGFLNWDGTIITGTILLIELLNYFHFFLFNPTHKKKKRVQYRDSFDLPFFKLGFRERKKSKKAISYLTLFIRFLNFYKMGLLLGFFIDAFKVGS